MKKINTAKQGINNNQRGFTLLEFIFAMSILSIAIVIGYQGLKHNSDQNRGRLIGIKLMEYNHGVSKFISVNSASNELRDELPDGEDELVKTGVNWLRSSECANPGLADYHFLPCNFTDGLPFIGGSSFTTRLDLSSESFIVAKTHFDISELTFGRGELVSISENMFGLATLTAMGGDGRNLVITDQEQSISSRIDDDGNATTGMLLASTDNQYIYCPVGVPEYALNTLCTIDDDNLKAGLIIAKASSQGSHDSWLRTDGSKAMDNAFVFSPEAANREIRFVDRIYNITDSMLKIGNSGVIRDSDFLPTLGDGVVFDTDTKISGSISSNLDIRTEGQIRSEKDIISEGVLISSEGINTGGNIDVAGNLTTSDHGVFANGLYSGGLLSSNNLRADSLVESQGFYVFGSVVSDRLATAKNVRSTELLISDRDLSVSNDATFSNDITVDNNFYTSANSMIEGNLAVENGEAYFSNLHADLIVDNDGNFLIDPSDVSMLNMLRTQSLSASELGGTLNLNAQSIYFASEDITCNVGDRDFSRCATKVGGYVDISSVMIKSPADGEWVSFLDVLVGLDEYNGIKQDEIDDTAVIITNPIPEPITGYECNGTTFAETMGTQSAVKAMNSGWSCAKQDGFVYEATGEDLYLCTASCEVPVTPVGQCTNSGVLDETVEVIGSTERVPSNWSCTETDKIGDTPIYTCEVPCTPELEGPECRYDNANKYVESKECERDYGCSYSSAYIWDGEGVESTGNGYLFSQGESKTSDSYWMDDTQVEIFEFEICREPQGGSWSIEKRIGGTKTYNTTRGDSCPADPINDARLDGFSIGSRRYGDCPVSGETHRYAQLIEYGEFCRAHYFEQECTP